LRKHQAFRPVNDAAFFYSTIPAEFTNSRLIARSVWNGQWKIVSPLTSLTTVLSAPSPTSVHRDLQSFIGLRSRGREDQPDDVGSSLSWVLFPGP